MDAFFSSEILETISFADEEEDVDEILAAASDSFENSYRSALPINEPQLSERHTPLALHVALYWNWPLPLLLRSINQPLPLLLREPLPLPLPTYRHVSPYLRGTRRF